MGDKDDGDTLIAKAAHDAAQFLNALRRKHGSRLVQDKHIAAVPKCADDFDLLLLAE